MHYEVDSYQIENDLQTPPVDDGGFGLDFNLLNSALNKNIDERLTYEDGILDFGTLMVTYDIDGDFRDDKVLFNFQNLDNRNIVFTTEYQLGSNPSVTQEYRCFDGQEIGLNIVNEEVENIYLTVPDRCDTYSSEIEVPSFIAKMGFERGIITQKELITDLNLLLNVKGDEGILISELDYDVGMAYSIVDTATMALDDLDLFFKHDESLYKINIDFSEELGSRTIPILNDTGTKDVWDKDGTLAIDSIDFHKFTLGQGWGDPLRTINIGDLGVSLELDLEATRENVNDGHTIIYAEALGFDEAGRFDKAVGSTQEISGPILSGLGWVVSVGTALIVIPYAIVKVFKSLR